MAKNNNAQPIYFQRGGKIFGRILVWGPLLGGIIHQILMGFFDRSAIYIFVPPTYIYPLVSVAYQWWFLLVLGSATLFILAYWDRPKRVTQHLSFPVYLYLLFLLMLVKPIF